MTTIKPRLERLGDALVYLNHELSKDQIEERLSAQSQTERIENQSSQFDPGSPTGVANENVLRMTNRISGVRINTVRIGRFRHRLEVESPPIYGQRFCWSEIVEESAIDDRLSYIARTINKAKVTILDAWFGRSQAQQATKEIRAKLSFFELFINGAKAAKVQGICNWDELDMLQAWHVIEAKKSKPYTEIFDVSALSVNDVPTGHRELWLIHLAMHEIFIELKNAIEEEVDMGKAPDAMVWWAIEGDPSKLKGLAVSLNRSSNYVVLDTPRRIFLKIQNSEKRFATGHARDHNLTAKRVTTEPEHALAECGKMVTDLTLHIEGGGGRGQSKCKSCQTLTQNKNNIHRKVAKPAEQVKEIVMANKGQQLRPSGTSPAIVPPDPKVAESKEWQSKNGEVIIIQGPTEGIDPMDFVALAKDYRRIADQVFERANYFSTLAAKYESLCQPSKALQEAEEALKEAQSKEASERAKQVEALHKMLLDGPPTS